MSNLHLRAGALVATLVATIGTAPAAAAQSTAPVRIGTRAAAPDTSRVVTFNREVFQYSPSGRRDPFVSLVTSSTLRPTINDLRLTTVAFDPTGRSSVAVLRDLGTKEQYRVRVGSVLGRMRVVRIDPKTVTFALEEFGYARQETISMGDSTYTRKP